ncbi:MULTISPECIES: hypothetical protein [unclassified Imperialibacter]|uniref:hypothetical protein n=1 Tax=unclassified Imperialibacter TaxID=2629706 RepID=UPI0012512BA6|nr:MULTISPECIES: hypothetical protein [unclassified Imperialibacter]CAD5277367.1 hypothetical protein IMPERIA89_440002 [Imperialibacter sp. 89]CAD5299421.1 hypothetical protein IMPERIA75_80002 [Imperialibacter sp. 75]VVT27427.1 hypothetical protein IMPR6_420002 [Imperialibacter sp. EC-SDR9]
MSDKEQNIENFFKKRLGQKDFPFREEDWLLMEARLDASAISTGGGGSSFVGLKAVAAVVVLTVIAFLSGWFLKEYFDNRESKNGEIGRVIQPKNSGASTLQMDSPATEESVSKPKILNENQPTETDAKFPGIEELSDRNGEVSASRAAGIASEDRAEQRGSSSQQTRAKEPAGAIFDADKSQVSNGNKVVPQTLQTADHPGVGNVNDFSEIGLKDGERPAVITHLSSKPLAHSPLVGYKAALNLAPLYAPNPPEAIPDEGFYRFAVGLAASPDVSSIGFHPSLKEIGKGFGFLAEYSPGRRWKLSGGVYKFDKVYAAGAGDYNPPFGSGWPGGIEPIRTDASCSVLDVPITVSLQVVNIGRTRIWVSAGMSSYWMLSENYSYVYEDGVEGRYKGWSGENWSNHPLSVVSASFSIETYLTRHFSVQLEPFVKAPLGGVGYGDVHLFTTGTLVTAKYHFLKKTIN